MTGTRRRALMSFVALALLLVAVAIASTGAVPAGSGGTRRPADRVFDVALSLVLLMLAFGVVMWVYILFIRKDAVANSLMARQQRSPWATVVGFAIFLGALALFIRWASVDEGFRKRITERFGRGQAGQKGGRPVDPNAYQPEFATGPVLIILAIIAIALVAWAISYRARRKHLGPMSPTLLPTLGDVLEETLDDLRAEADPRQAVIAAYARMERALAAYGLPRRPAEAPDEYLQRIFADLDVSRRATSRLTALFAWAKFSAHDVAPEMKLEAIAALEAVLDELRASEIVAEDRRLAVLTELRNRGAR